MPANRIIENVLKEIQQKQMGFYFLIGLLSFFLGLNISGGLRGEVQVAFYICKKNLGLESYCLCDELLTFSKIWGEKKTLECKKGAILSRFFFSLKISLEHQFQSNGFGLEYGICCVTAMSDFRKCMRFPIISFKKSAHVQFGLKCNFIQINAQCFVIKVCVHKMLYL